MSEERDAVEKTLRDLIDAVGMDVTLAIEESPDQLYFNIQGPDSQYFMGFRGELLRELAYALHAYHRKHFPDSDLDIKVDADAVLKSKEDELSGIAEEAAARLREPGEEVGLGPFNSYERRLVHLALKDREDVETRSVGEGPMKKVVVRKTGASGGGDEEE